MVIGADIFLSSLVASIVLSVTSKATSGDAERTGDYVLKTGGALERQLENARFIKETQSYRFQLFTLPTAGKNLKQSMIFF